MGDKLRELADWLDRHAIAAEDVIEAGCWGALGGPHVNMRPDALRRIYPARELVESAACDWNSNVLVRFDDGGVEVACVYEDRLQARMYGVKAKGEA